jgi:hypothetical protein
MHSGSHHRLRAMIFFLMILAASATSVHAASCAPGSTCLSVQTNGASAPGPGPFTAQCTGTFPDFIAASALVPPNGPWFKLSQAYPTTSPTIDAPWLNIQFSGGLTGANNYLYALRDYAFEGMVDADFRPELSNARPWFHMPLMNFGPNRREPVHGLTGERSVQGPELGVKPGVTIHNYAIGFYNASGAFTIRRSNDL